MRQQLTRGFEARRKGMGPARRWVAIAVGVALSLNPTTPLVWAGPPFAEFVDPNPAPGNRFGETVVALSTGNVVITSPYDDAGGPDAGAVYLFNGATGALISTLLGSSANDHIGGGAFGVTVLTNGNYVIRSLDWDNGAAMDAGALTWGSGMTGVSGVVSASNSLVSSVPGGTLARFLVKPLTNGNYVVSSLGWDNGPAIDAGAVTWCNGSTGTSGVVSAANSLVGSTSQDRIGNYGVAALPNGNYVVSSPGWDNGAAVDAGAVTWGNGMTGVAGAIGPTNSLIGSTSNDLVGSKALDNVPVTILGNGHYIVSSPYWDNGPAVDVGAVTWGDGDAGVSGVVGPSNSLTGAKAGDSIGWGIVPLTNGSYVVTSPKWDNGSVADAGAATWVNGSAGTSGIVGVSNSLVGSTKDDWVGNLGVAALPNGNYVVSSPGWDKGAVVDAGGATWGNGLTGTTGTVSVANSLVGSRPGDNVGGGVAALTNGNYVVRSIFWSDGVSANVGAATLGNGTTGTTGIVDASNSLVGTTAGDWVGAYVTPLANGNYVVASPYWSSGGVARAGAVTWADGTTGLVGVVGPSNSLVGSSPDDMYDVQGMVIPLANGSYVVACPRWDGAAPNVGAVTWGSGIAGVSGPIGPSISLVGSSADDQVGGSCCGESRVIPLPNGNYVVQSQFWNNGLAVDAGASTWGSGVSGVVGPVSAANSLVGSTSEDYSGFVRAAGGSNGNYVSLSSWWDNGSLANVGAVTLGSGMGGTVGVLSAISLVGTTPNTGLAGVVFDSVNGTYLASFLTDGGGRVRLGSLVGGVPPTLGLASSSNLEMSTATLSSSVVADHGFPVTARGFVYSMTTTNSTPTIGGAGVAQILVPGTTGPISSPVAGLAPATSYSFRAFAMSAAGTGYSTGGTFTTLSSRVFVASSGNDAHECSAQATPCRTLHAAIDQVGTDGEVIVLSPGEYDTAPLLIGKGVKITSPSGTVAFIRQPITVNAPGSRVALRGLTLKGNGASSAITLIAADALSIEDTTVDSWSVGLDIANAAPSSLAILTAAFQGNQTAVRDLGPASNRASIAGSRFVGNGTGLSTSAGTFVVRGSSFAANATAVSIASGLTEISRSELWSNGVGLAVLSGGTARIGRSHVFGNTTGLSAAGGSTLASFGSNVIRGNGTNVDGVVTTVPEQ